MVHQQFHPALRPLVIAAVVTFLHPLYSSAQNGSEYQPGKMYVIRVSEPSATRIALELRMPSLAEEMRNGGVTEYMVDHLFIAKKAQEAQWFFAYFDEQRQTKEDLMRDMDLLTWFYHGHHAQILPLELLDSPLAPQLSQEPVRKK